VSKTYFVSDIHLNSRDEERRRGFLDFLGCCGEDAGELYVLGDLFDVWSGPSQMRSKACVEVAAAMRALVNRGVKVSVLPGNRDFMLDAEFEKEAGVELLGESVIVRLADLNVFLTHGDSLCTGDIPFALFRSLIRTKPVMDFYRALPDSLSGFLAKGLRHHSRRTIGQKKSKMFMMDELIESKFKLGIDVVVCGHVHATRHAEYRLNGSTHHLYVLGDWSNQGSYLTCDGGEFRHHTFRYRGQ